MHFLNNSPQPPRLFWSFVRSLRKINPLFPISKTKTHSAALILVKLTCSTMLSMNSSHKTPPLHHLLHHLLPHHAPEDILCSTEIVHNLIAQLPENNFPGCNGITSFFLKATGSSILYPLSIIFNHSIELGIFLSTWKLSTVIAIPKTSHPSDSPTEAISLLSLVSKLLEKHVASILFDHLFPTSSSHLISSVSYHID